MGRSRLLQGMGAWGIASAVPQRCHAPLYFTGASLRSSPRHPALQGMGAWGKASAVPQRCHAPHYFTGASLRSSPRHPALQRMGAWGIASAVPQRCHAPHCFTGASLRSSPRHPALSPAMLRPALLHWGFATLQPQAPGSTANGCLGHSVSGAPAMLRPALLHWGFASLQPQAPGSVPSDATPRFTSLGLRFAPGPGTRDGMFAAVAHPRRGRV
jgi:hypothetical protein